MNHRARVSGVPDAGSRQRFRLSRVEIVPYIAATASTLTRKAAAAEEIMGAGVSSLAPPYKSLTSPINVRGDTYA